MSAVQYERVVNVPSEYLPAFITAIEAAVTSIAGKSRRPTVVEYVYRQQVIDYFMGRDDLSDKAAKDIATRIWHLLTYSSKEHGLEVYGIVYVVICDVCDLPHGECRCEKFGYANELYSPPNWVYHADPIIDGHWKVGRKSIKDSQRFLELDLIQGWGEIRLRLMSEWVEQL